MAIEDRRSPMSIGIGWASRITTLGFEFAIPALLGHFFDGRLGTKPVLLLVGMTAGFILGLVHLLRIAREGSNSR